MGEKGEWSHSGRYLMVCKELEFFLPFNYLSFVFHFNHFQLNPAIIFLLSASISRTKPTTARYYS